MASIGSGIATPIEGIPLWTRQTRPPLGRRRLYTVCPHQARFRLRLRASRNSIQCTASATGNAVFVGTAASSAQGQFLNISLCRILTAGFAENCSF